jgi:hypothetical protein
MRAAADEAEATPPPATGPALRLLWQSIGPFFEAISASPPLPSDLLPADWPMGRARAEFLRLAAAVAERARQHVVDLDDGRAAVA